MENAVIERLPSDTIDATLDALIQDLKTYQQTGRFPVDDDGPVADAYSDAISLALSLRSQLVNDKPAPTFRLVSEDDGPTPLERMRQARDEFAKRERAKRKKDRQQRKAQERQESGQRQQAVAKPQNDYQRFIAGAVDSWNELKLETWLPVDNLDGRLFKELAAIWNDNGRNFDAASTSFRQGVTWLRNEESWARGITLSMAEALANGKITRYAKKYQHRYKSKAEDEAHDMASSSLSVGTQCLWRGSVRCEIVGMLGGNAVMVSGHSETLPPIAYTSDLRPV